MPPYSNDERVQGLHYLSVIEAAKKLAALLSVNKQARDEILKIASCGTELDTLMREVGRLAMFERRAAARGTVKMTLGEDVERAVNIARERPDYSLEEQDAVKQAYVTGAENMFDTEELLGSGAKQLPAPVADDVNALIGDMLSEEIEDPCQAGKHVWTLPGNGFTVCERCGLEVGPAKATLTFDNDGPKPPPIKNTPDPAKDEDLEVFDV